MTELLDMLARTLNAQGPSGPDDQAEWLAEALAATELLAAVRAQLEVHT